MAENSPRHPLLTAVGCPTTEERCVESLERVTPSSVGPVAGYWRAPSPARGRRRPARWRNDELSQSFVQCATGFAPSKGATPFPNAVPIAAALDHRADDGLVRSADTNLEPPCVRCSKKGRVLRSRRPSPRGSGSGVAARHRYRIGVCGSGRPA